MIKRRDEIQVTFKRKEPGSSYPEPRTISIIFYGGDPEMAIDKARKIFQLGDDLVLDEAKGEGE